jgi:phosphatidylserine/phosphatidylglycerophosphate/cardiolipin synthase-like enzyme
VKSIDLCNEYRSYAKEIKQTLLEWVNEWKKQERINTELNHFFLEDTLLDKFSESLIENAKLEILVASPYVEQCHVSNLLSSMSQKGIDTRLLTRSIKLDQYYYEKKVKYLSKLAREGVSVTYDETIHAKLIVVDRRVAIVSSMNFYAGSSGGASWEAGLVTTEADVVQSIARSILSRIQIASIDQ